MVNLAPKEVSYVARPATLFDVKGSNPSTKARIGLFSGLV
jgi:hypothetical protein